MKKLQGWIDKASVSISVILLAIMMLILVLNIILRYTPGVGGVKWYMESTQYLNVWSMFVVGISICARKDHLNVNLLQGLVKGIGQNILKCLVAFFTVLFYIGLAYATFILASKSGQDISTMPMFKMSMIYWFIPIVTILSAASTIIALAIDLTDKNQVEGGDKA
ncbi:MAG: C4-dicarboxylate ABC transporter permease [Firmicutes bacterium HGW-Firmicutes-7]|nr:MAG: C4-dicarboxylate ABC transporter permease [Firmicutes bacterium HGW-Firmicutes-7]